MNNQKIKKLNKYWATVLFKVWRSSVKKINSNKHCHSLSLCPNYLECLVEHKSLTTFGWRVFLSFLHPNIYYVNQFFFALGPSAKSRVPNCWKWYRQNCSNWIILISRGWPDSRVVVCYIKVVLWGMAKIIYGVFFCVFLIRRILFLLLWVMWRT